MDNNARSVALDRLTPFIGKWRLEASFPPASPAGAASSDRGDASAVFEWALGRQFVIQHSIAPHPAPDSLAIISVDVGRDRYLQHYFDSRGVVRVYAMTLNDGVWTLLRESADFSDLAFSQRFTGTFSNDGDSIVGHWETSRDGSPWEHDFDLTYSRVR
jgi:hypothetical protein